MIGRRARLLAIVAAIVVPLILASIVAGGVLRRQPQVRAPAGTLAETRRDLGAGPHRRFLVQDVLARQWCLYDDPATARVGFEQVLEGGDPVASATLHYLDGRLQSIDLFRDTPTGEWRIEDRYSVSGGALVGLTRRVHLAPANLTLETGYDLTPGAFTVRSRLQRRLKDGPTGTPENIPPVPPIHTSADDMPFAAMLGPRVAPGDRSCAPTGLDGAVVAPVVE